MLEIKRKTIEATRINFVRSKYWYKSLTVLNFLQTHGQQLENMPLNWIYSAKIE